MAAFKVECEVEFSEEEMMLRAIPLTDEQQKIADELSMDMVTRLQRYGYKLDDSKLLSVIESCKFVARSVTNR
jgi:hypothetical protein